MMSADRRKITLTLDAATGDRLEAAAALEGISVDEYCKEAIEVQLDEDEIYRAPVKLTQEYVDRFARIREERANMKETERATEPKGERELSGRRATIKRLSARLKEISGDKPSRRNSADDIRQMREERALNLERSSKGRRRKSGD